MSKKGLNVIAFDISQVQLDRLKDYHTVCGNVLSLPFNEGMFDSVLCSELLEHLDNPEVAIKEIYRVLKVGGIACFTTPCVNIPYGKKLINIYRKVCGIHMVVDEHKQVFNTQSLIDILSPPFEIVGVRYTKFTNFLQWRFGVGYGLDRALADITKYILPLKYLAQSHFIKVKKS
jgi:SAM-dependent methyltransferase